MIARSTQSALVALLVLGSLGLTTPQSVEARGRESHSHRQHGHEHHGYYNAPRYAPPRGHGWRSHPNYYAPRHCPDVVAYPRYAAPRVYYYSPVETVYPREYGSLGIHLDYNLLY